MKIGQIAKTANGFEGTLHTLTVKAAIQLTPTDNDNEKAPGFRVLADGAEIGAAWEKTSKNDTPYLSFAGRSRLCGPVYAVANIRRRRASGHPL